MPAGMLLGLSKVGRTSPAVSLHDIFLLVANI